MIKKQDAEGTRNNQGTHLKAYNRFCNEYELHPFPADMWRYCQFGQFLANEHKVPGTVENYVNTVHTLHKYELLPGPEPEKIHFVKLIHGLKREQKTSVRQAEPMTHQLLLDLF